MIQDSSTKTGYKHLLRKEAEIKVNDVKLNEVQCSNVSGSSSTS